MQRTALLILAAVLAVNQAGAQSKPDPAALSAEAAVELAVANNAGLARDRVDLAAAERSLGRAWNEVLPGLTLSAGTSQSNASETRSVYGSIGASVTIRGTVFTSVERARVAYEAETLAYDTAVRDLELKVRKSFYSLILAQENISVLRQGIATAQKNYEQAEAKRRSGLATELDALSAQVDLENLRPSLESALVEYENSLAEFKLLLGMAQTDAIALAGSLDEAAALSEIDFSGLSGESPAVVRLRKSVESARVGVKAAKAAVLSPALTLSGKYQPTRSSGSSGWADSGSLSAVVSFSLDNLLPWSEARETADKAEDSLAKAQSELDEAQTSAGISLRSLRREIEQSLSTLKARRLTLDLAERTYRLTEEAYRYGTKDLLSLQGAADSLQEARVNLLKEAYNLISSVLDLEYASGVPFGTLGRKS